MWLLSRRRCALPQRKQLRVSVASHFRQPFLQNNNSRRVASSVLVARECSPVQNTYRQETRLLLLLVGNSRFGVITWSLSQNVMHRAFLGFANCNGTAFPQERQHEACSGGGLGGWVSGPRTVGLNVAQMVRCALTRKVPLPISLARAVSRSR